MTVRIVTDSTSDLTAEQLHAHGISMVPLNVHFGDEVYLDQIDLTPAPFFEKLAASRTLPKTSQPSPGQFEVAYRRLAGETDNIVSVHISARLSATIRSAQLAAGSFHGHPRIEIVDSKTTSVGLGILAIEAARMAREGHASVTIADALCTMRERLRLVFFVDTLEYLQRGGRIGKAQAFIGSLVNIKPILQVLDGEIQPLERVRSRQKAVDRLAMAIDTAVGPRWIAILHDRDRPEVKTLVEHATRRVDPDHVLVSPYGPVIGTHVGPGALGVAWLPKD